LAKQPPKYPHIQNPSTRIYWDDLHAEPGLKIVSLAARGLWTYHMLAIMAASGGYLAIEGTPLTVEALAAIVGKPLDEVRSAFLELKTWKVFSVDRFETPYNRRMVKMQKKVMSNRRNGLGGGRPRKDLSTDQGEFVEPVDNFAENRGISRGVQNDVKKSVKKVENRGVSKSLKTQANFNSETHMEPNRNPNHNPNDGPRARGSQDSLNTREDLRTLRLEKNPASAGETHMPASITPGRLNGGKIAARIIRLAQRQDTPENRAWANRLSLALPSELGLELTRYETPATRIAELISEGERIMNSG
jgi:hypothetical protein